MALTSFTAFRSSLDVTGRDVMLRVDRRRDADEVAPLLCSIIESLLLFLPLDSNEERSDCVDDCVVAVPVLEGDPFFPNEVDRRCLKDSVGVSLFFPNEDRSADLGLVVLVESSRKSL